MGERVREKYLYIVFRFRHKFLRYVYKPQSQNAREGPQSQRVSDAQPTQTHPKPMTTSNSSK
jgi:hypothetical protein